MSDLSVLKPQTWSLNGSSSEDLYHMTRSTKPGALLSSPEAYGFRNLFLSGTRYTAAAWICCDSID